MEWIAAIAFVLVLLWIARRREAETPRPPPSLPDPRGLLAREMLNRAAKADRGGHYEEAQRMRLKAAWLRTYPPLGQDDPPPVIDPNAFKHLMLVDDLRRQYAALLADESGPYSQCAFKPTALLPYPKASIAEALELLIALGRGDTTSRHLEPDAISREDLEAIERSRQLLDTFLDIAPDDLPTDPDENLRYGRDLLS